MKRLAFVVKYETTKSFTINDGILGVFLPKKLLSLDQYAFGTVRYLIFQPSFSDSFRSL